MSDGHFSLRDKNNQFSSSWGEKSALCMNVLLHWCSVCLLGDSPGTQMGSYSAF